MSKFIDTLKRLSRGEPQTLGFRTQGTTSPRPKIQLVASIPRDKMDSLSKHVAGADAGLLHISDAAAGDKAIQKLEESISGIPWGVRLSQDSRIDVEHLAKAGGDFFVFPASTPLSMFQKEGVGRILEVDTSLSEGMLRAAAALQVDALLITGLETESPLTWQHLMQLHRFAALVNKPLIVAVPASITGDEIEALWQARTDGIVIQVTGDLPRDRIRELRKAIDALPFPAKQRREESPLVPRIRMETPPVETEEEEEEEED